MKLTICTAVLNAGGAGVGSPLERCIRSVAALPFEHEHLVYDGGSVDGSAEVLRRIENEIPSLRVVFERDSGIYDALNKGVRDARGDYFYVLGADDWICDQAEMEDALRQVCYDNADILVSPVLLDDGQAWPPVRSDVFDLLDGISYSHQGALVRTSLIRSLGGYDDSYRIVADYKLHLLAHLQGARTVCRWRSFARVCACGLSGRSPKMLQQEGVRVRREVFELTEAEQAHHCCTGVLSPRKWMRLLWCPEPFTRSVGWACARRWLWHKHKGEVLSTWRLAGVPLFAWHRRIRAS